MQNKVDLSKQRDLDGQVRVIYDKLVAIEIRWSPWTNCQPAVPLCVPPCGCKSALVCHIAKPKLEHLYFELHHLI